MKYRYSLTRQILLIFTVLLMAKSPLQSQSPKFPNPKVERKFKKGTVVIPTRNTSYVEKKVWWVLDRKFYLPKKNCTVGETRYFYKVRKKGARLEPSKPYSAYLDTTKSMKLIGTWHDTTSPLCPPGTKSYPEAQHNCGTGTGKPPGFAESSNSLCSSHYCYQIFIDDGGVSKVVRYPIGTIIKKWD